MNEPLLETVGLKKYFKTPRGLLHAVDDVNLSIPCGKTLGVVGESGCGKSTLGRTLLRLIEPTSGQVLYRGENIFTRNKRQMLEIRKKMQMIFQDPYSSLDPRMSVRDIIAEGLKIHQKTTNREEFDEKVAETMKLVGLTPDLMNRYPYEFSGGQRQRIGIARSLAVEPEFVVADEPLSALDVSIQAQIVQLMEHLKEVRNLTYLFIAHDISMVKYISDRIGVMYHGKLLELGTADEIVNHPLHPYTQSLLSAVPVPDPTYERVRKQFTYDEEPANVPLREVKPGHYVALA